MMTALAPSTLAIRFDPSSDFNHFKAPARALPLLPPTKSPSDLINLRAAINDSSSFVFSHSSISPTVRVRTSGIKS